MPAWQRIGPSGLPGGFRNAARYAGVNPKAWLVLNGDSLICADPLQLAGLLETGADAALLARTLPDTGRYGRLTVDDSGWLKAFAEKTGGPGLVNAGVYLLRASLVERLSSSEPLSFELDVFPTWLQQGANIAVRPVDAPFLDIGTEETLSQANDFIRKNHKEFA